MAEKISESRFYMWRALFAVAHADQVVTAQEKTMMHRIIAENPFNETQAEVLRCDIEQKQDVRFLFARISDPEDRSLFFDHARTLVWCDGQFAGVEQDVIAELSRMHFQSADLDALGDHGGFSLADEREGAAPDQLADSLLMKVMKTLGGVNAGKQGVRH